MGSIRNQNSKEQTSTVADCLHSCRSGRVRGALPDRKRSPYVGQAITRLSPLSAALEATGNRLNIGSRPNDGKDEESAKCQHLHLRMREENAAEMQNRIAPRSCRFQSTETHVKIPKIVKRAGRSHQEFIRGRLRGEDILCVPSHPHRQDHSSILDNVRPVPKEHSRLVNMTRERHFDGNLLSLEAV